MNLRGFVAAFTEKSYFCKRKSIGEQSVDVQNLVMTFRASQPVDFFFYASIAVMQYCTFSPVRFTPTIIFTRPMPINSWCISSI